jgi:hypothetical protein
MVNLTRQLLIAGEKNPLGTSLGGSPRRSGRYGEKEKSLLFTDNQTRIIQAVVQSTHQLKSYVYWAVNYLDR